MVTRANFVEDKPIVLIFFNRADVEGYCSELKSLSWLDEPTGKMDQG
jgi:hypothetical protein